MRKRLVTRIGAPLRVIGALTALAAAGCSANRELPRGSLVVRAWEGHEPVASQDGLYVLAFASAQVGKRYCWGGTGPSCFDCSGLAQTAWRQVGAHIPRTADAIADSLPEIALSQVRIGDLLWWPGHVGLYAGNGWTVEALDHKHGVVRRAALTPYRAFRPVVDAPTAVRPLAPLAPPGRLSYGSE